MLAATGQSAVAKAAWRASLMRKIVSRRLWANSFNIFWQKMWQAGLATISHQWVATKKSSPEDRKLRLKSWVLQYGCVEVPEGLRPLCWLCGGRGH